MSNQITSRHHYRDINKVGQQIERLFYEYDFNLQDEIEVWVSLFKRNAQTRIELGADGPDIRYRLARAIDEIIAAIGTFIDEKNSE